MPDPIRTARLTLRPLAETDRLSMAAALSDIEVSKWLARVPHPFGPEDVRILPNAFPEQAAIDLFHSFQYTRLRYALGPQGEQKLHDGFGAGSCHSIPLRAEIMS